MFPPKLYRDGKNAINAPILKRVFAAMILEVEFGVWHIRIGARNSKYAIMNVFTVKTICTCALAATSESES